MKRIMLPIVFSLFIFLVIPISAIADSRISVLGDNTKNINILNVPPTSEGPGRILPDSPLYFLDVFKENIQLLFANTPAKRATLYATEAGENQAEVRFEVQRNNIGATEIALRGLGDNTRKAADQLTLAKFSGVNVDALAREINLSIKTHLGQLDIVESQSSGEIKAALSWADITLTSAKEKVENSMSKDELANEIRDDLIRQTNKLAFNTANNATLLKMNLDMLQTQASNAANNNLQARNVALQNAIAEKNLQLKAAEELKIAQIRQKTDISLALQNQAATQAQNIIQQAQDVIKKIQTTQQIANAPDNNPVLGVQTQKSK